MGKATRMDERRRERAELLPEASEGFTQAILAGADEIYRRQRRNRRRSRAALAVAAALLVAAGLGAAVRRLGAPRPDNVVLSVSPGRTAAPEQPSPEPTAVPAPTGEARWDEAEGLEYLLDAGPFEPGDWAVLTDPDGALVYGHYVRFCERPSADAAGVTAPVGALARYLGDSGNGFAMVAFAGRDGYVPRESLRRGTTQPAISDCEQLVDAALYLTNAEGEIADELIQDFEGDGEGWIACHALLKLLQDMEPADPAECADAPFGAMLRVRVRKEWETPVYGDNGLEQYVQLRFTLPRDGQPFLMTEDGGLFALSPPDAKCFWTIFAEVGGEVW